MKFLVRRLLIAVAFLLIIPSLQSFTTTTNNDDCLIVLAIAYKDVFFDSGSEKVKFQEPVAYQFMYTTKTNNYNNVAAYVKKLLIDNHNVLEKDIVLSSDKKSKCVLIQYQKEYEAYGKKLVRFAFGFGATEAEAERNAEIQKNTDVPEKVPYFILDTVGCVK